MPKGGRSDGLRSLTLGKVKIAEMLCRAGLHLGATTVGRILKESPAPQPEKQNPPTSSVAPPKRKTIVTAKYPNHVWHVDLTCVPTAAGCFVSWLPFALPQCWPFCWWVVVVLDHYSRRAMGVAVFKKQPTSLEVRTFLGRTIGEAGTAPKHLISDKGAQFWPCKAYRKWCRRHGIKPRFGAIGQKGSIAVIERFIRTLKSEGTRNILVPLRKDKFRWELLVEIDWYNEYRPHMTLDGSTPNEVYYDRRRRRGLLQLCTSTGGARASWLATR